MSTFDLPQGLAPPGLAGGLPPGLAEALGPPAAGPPPGLPAGLQPEMAPPAADPLQALQDAIHSVASAMASLPGAQDTQDAAQALLVLSRIQTRLMGPQGAAPQG